MRRRTLAVVLGVLALAGLAAAADKDRIPYAYRVEATVLEPDGSTAVHDIGFGTGDLREASAKVWTVHRDGFCLAVEGDPDLVATCYPPGRLLRTQIIRSWM